MTKIISIISDINNENVSQTYGMNQKLFLETEFEIHKKEARHFYC